MVPDRRLACFLPELSERDMILPRGGPKRTTLVGIASASTFKVQPISLVGYEPS